MTGSVPLQKCRVLLAEDHQLMREGLSAMLEAEPEFDIVGEVDNGKDAVRSVLDLEPDLVLMDLSMPKSHGAEAIREVKRRSPQTKVIALTVHKADEYVHAALQAGAHGYVLKDDGRSDLLAALKSVRAGKVYLSPSISGRVVAGYLAGTKGGRLRSAWETLTSRERQVLKLIAEGYKNRQIAEYLSVSAKTVEKHRSNLMKKLDLHSAPALIAYALKEKLVD